MKRNVEILNNSLNTDQKKDEELKKKEEELKAIAVRL